MTISRVLKLTKRTCIFVMLLCVVNTVSADKQVLVSFDLGGFYVSRIIETATVRSFRQDTTHNRSQRYEKVIPDPQKAVKALAGGTAGLIWLDRHGYQIDVATMPDPRISHSPGHIIALTETRVAVDSGAWLVKAPDMAEFLIVMLAAEASVSLGEEVWELSLIGVDQ